jgi:hypothetical protein
VEETIGYEDLFSPEEWEELPYGYWDADENSDASNDCAPKAEHRVTIVESGERDDGEECYELECDVCGPVGAAESSEDAAAITRLHESFVATLVESWSVEE